MVQEKTYHFMVAGKLEAENEDEATALLHEILGERTQFQIDSLVEEED